MLIFILGLIDLLAGFLGLITYSLNVLEGVTSVFLTLLLFKGVYSIYTSKLSPLFLGLGVLDFITGLFGLLYINYGVFYALAYITAFIVLFKGLWSSFGDLFKSKT